MNLEPIDFGNRLLGTCSVSQTALASVGQRQGQNGGDVVGLTADELLHLTDDQRRRLETKFLQKMKEV